MNDKLILEGVVAKGTCRLMCVLIEMLLPLIYGSDSAKEEPNGDIENATKKYLQLHANKKLVSLLITTILNYKIGGESVDNPWNFLCKFNVLANAEELVAQYKNVYKSNLLFLKNGGLEVYAFSIYKTTVPALSSRGVFGTLEKGYLVKV